MARALITHRDTILQLLIQEGKKTIEDGLSEIREAIDYCYYYGETAKQL